MATLEIFTVFLFFFFLSKTTSSATGATCGASLTCTLDGPLVRFPFRLIGRGQPLICGFPGFDLSCNDLGRQTILNLPFGFGNVIVSTINYRVQSLWINDPKNCFPRRFLHNEFSLLSSPFSYKLAHSNYTFLSCPPQAAERYPFPPISCLSTENYKIIAVPTGSPIFSTPSTLGSSSLSSSCYVISTALVPLRSPFDWEDLINFGVQLTWYVPDCRSCEAMMNKVCGFKNDTSSQVLCSFPPNNDDSPTPSANSRPERLFVMISLGILGLLFMTVFAIKIKASDRLHQPITELSTQTNRPPAEVIDVRTTGLNSLTIESYPKTELGESLELPKSGDNTCPICLAEYKPKETLRTIPECNHYFHASCIDEWLRRNAMCPFCRKPPEDEKTSH